MTRLEQDYCDLAIKTLLNGDCLFDANALIVRCGQGGCSSCTAYNKDYNNCEFNILLDDELPDEMNRIETLIIFPLLQANYPELLL